MAGTMMATIDSEDKRTSNIFLADFANGRLKPECCDSIRFKAFEGKTSKRKNEKVLVAETDRLAYVGHSSESSSAHCKYMLAVFDRRKGKVRLYDAQMMKMKPYFGDKKDQEKDEVDGEKLMSFSEKSDRLTSAFGSKKKKQVMESKHKNKVKDNVLEQALDTAVGQLLAKPGAEELIKPMEKPTEASAEIPPHNLNAQRPEDVYLLRDLISASEMEALQSTVSVFTEIQPGALTKWRQEESFPTCILTHLSMLPLEPKARQHKASCLMYLHYMITMYRFHVKDLRKKDPFRDDVPSLIKKKLLGLFSVEMPGASRPVRCMPARLKDKLLSYILVLCLILDNYSLEFSNLMKDLKIGQQRLCTFLKALGCQVKVKKISTPDEGDLQVCSATLNVPLKFPEKTTKMKKDRR